MALPTPNISLSKTQYRNRCLLSTGNRNNSQIDVRINAQTILWAYAQIIFTLRNNSQTKLHSEEQSPNYFVTLFAN